MKRERFGLWNSERISPSTIVALSQSSDEWLWHSDRSGSAVSISLIISSLSLCITISVSLSFCLSLSLSPHQQHNGASNVHNSQSVFHGCRCSNDSIFCKKILVIFHGKCVFFMQEHKNKQIASYMVHKHDQKYEFILPYISSTYGIWPPVFGLLMWSVSCMHRMLQQHELGRWAILQSFFILYYYTDI